MRKWIIVLVILVLGIITYKYIYQDHRNIATESADFKLTAQVIYNEFLINPVASEKLYLNKTMEIRGFISDQNKTSITLDKNVFCQFTKGFEKLVDSSQITIKGRFIGYDDLLEQVKLDQCTIINKH